MIPRAQKERSTSKHLRVVSEPDGAGPLGFEAIYAQFFKYVAAVALRLLGDESEVDDVVQEVFWTCFRKIDTLRDMEHARRWLIKVTVRRIRKRLRRRKLTALFHHTLNPMLDPPMPSASADDRAAVIHLFSRLETVPVNHRLAWSLKYLDGASLGETAAACGCSLATVKRWIAKTQAVVTGGEDG